MRNGFLAGNGNAHGAGVYFAKTAEGAKSYAGRSGVYLKCLLQPKRVATWDDTLAQQFNVWCARRNVSPDNNARTAFLLRERYDVLENGTLVVVLRPLFANPAAHKVKLRQIRVLGVYRADTDKRIRV